MKRIALIEDDKLLLKRMASFLNSQEELECVLAAPSLGSFFEALPDSPKIDLAIIDIELSGTINTIDHLQKLQNLLPETRILVITGHNHPDYIFQALRKGAHSFFLKGAGLDKLLEAIDITCAGGAYLAPEAAAYMIPFFNQQNEQHGSKLKQYSASTPAIPGHEQLELSLREREVAQRLANGHSYQEIASELFLSLNTVRHYVKVLYKKFDVSNKVQLSKKIQSYL